MSFCEQTQQNFKQILNAIPDVCRIQLHGSYRYPVYPGWKSGIQNYHDLHILYVLSGKGYYHMSDGTNIPLEQGTLVFISHDVKHYATVESNAPLKINGFRFGLYAIDNTYCTNQYSNPFYYYTQSNDFQYYTELTRKIHHIYHTKKDAISQTASSMYIYQLIYDLYQILLQEPAQTEIDFRIEKAREIIETYSLKKISILEISQSLNMSSRYLQKKFKQVYGFTPKEYHIHIQMNVAYSLLKNESLPVSTLAEKLGYSDSFTFSKQFKKFFGYPPRSIKTIK